MLPFVQDEDPVVLRASSFDDEAMATPRRSYIVLLLHATTRYLKDPDRPKGYSPALAFYNAATKKVCTLEALFLNRTCINRPLIYYFRYNGFFEYTITYQRSTKSEIRIHSKVTK